MWSIDALNPGLPASRQYLVHERHDVERRLAIEARRYRTIRAFSPRGNRPRRGRSGRLAHQAAAGDGNDEREREGTLHSAASTGSAVKSSISSTPDVS